ncbi:MAG: nucleoside phosphorylase [Spirochaetales bacterium]|nr:nucleoside phosphorylase [Spirochaetales bacterium]
MSSKQAHIRLSEEDGARFALLPGDPGRIDHIKTFLDNPEELVFNREMRSVSGTYMGVNVLAVSTGMGGASTGIAVEELRNIGVEYMIRIGSCGALQRGIKLGDLIIVNGAVRDEGASKAYVDPVFPAVPDHGLLFSCVQAAQEQKLSYHVGIARSHDSFYTDREEEIDAYWAGKGVLGCDMETAALFTIGSLRGVKCASILNTVVEFEEDLEQNINDYVDGESIVKKGEADEIRTALEAFVRESKKGN